MATNFPTGLDALTNPAPTDPLNAPSHSDQHINANDAIEALQTKVGIDSSAVTTSLDYLVKNAASSNPGHTHTLADGATDITATEAELNVLDGITATTAELNILDGVTATTGELNILDGVTANAADLNTTTDGWQVLSTIPTRQSADDPVFVLRFAADMTGILTEGMRLEVTQSTVKYFIIHDVGTFSGGNTDVTVYGGTDFDVADTGVTAISAIRYSREKIPFGFPANPDKWTTRQTSTALLSVTASDTTTVSNIGSFSLDVPIGLWNLVLQANFSNSFSGERVFSTIGVSTSNNSFSNNVMTGEIDSRAAGSGATAVASRTICHIQDIVELSSKTTYYVNVQARVGATQTMFLDGTRTETRLEAISAYL